MVFAFLFMTYFTLYDNLSVIHVAANGILSFFSFLFFKTYSIHGGSDKESACNVGDQGLISGLGRSSGEGNGKPL